jgi:crotonobetainyl-CoA:carnitine CoA-transferase CaiB-like acyl-CoA transferase
LGGLRVLEVADTVSGAFCGKLLAAVGASVIKVEPPIAGDPSRRTGPFPDDVPHPERSGAYLYLNTGKKSITLNLRDAEGQAIMRQLASRCDVLIHTQAPAASRDLGLDAESLAEANPDLIVAALTPFGSSGPYADYRAREINIFHAGGEGWLLPNGLALDTFPDRAPLVAGSDMGAYQAGLTAALGILAAVFAGNNGIPGQAIDASSQEAQLAIGYLPIQRLEAEGLVEDRFSRYFRVGGVLAAQDGYVELLTLEPRQWEALYAMLENPEWAAPEKFQEPAKYGMEINEGLRQWAKQHTKEWLYQQGQARGVPIAPYYTPGEVFHSAQQRARDFFTPVAHPESGCLEYAGLPFRFGESPLPLDRALLLGEHNREVYLALGYASEEVSTLARAGVI